MSMGFLSRKQRIFFCRILKDLLAVLVPTSQEKNDSRFCILTPPDNGELFNMLGREIVKEREREKVRVRERR